MKTHVLNGVRMVHDECGITYHVPMEMTSSQFDKWKKRNLEAINNFKTQTDESNRSN